MITRSVDINTLKSNVSNSIGLCYFDNTTEQLREFINIENIYLTPFETSVRRYYLVKTSDLIDNLKPTFASMTVISNSTDIDIKISLGKDNLTDIYDFYDLQVNNSINIFFNNYPSGIIPVDFYFKSNTTRKIDINFDINIEVL